MEERKIRVALTHGDTNGVGYELIFKTFENLTMLELCTPIIYGSPKVATYHRNALGIQTNFTIISQAEEAREGRLNLLTVFDEEIKVEMGTPTEESGNTGLRAIDRALEDYEKGLVDVLVTAPIDNTEDFHFSGQSRYLEDHLNAFNKGISILTHDKLRIALATRNLPLKQVTESVTLETIKMKAEALHLSLRRDFMITNPRIAVLALNPKAGDKGLIGTEEKEIIAPAIQQLVEKGIQAFGPYAADDFFGKGYYSDFDGILAMYYDQGLTPFRSLVGDEGVNFTAGLPIVRTAPLHNALFSQAGKNMTDCTSMRHALYTAIDIFKHRKAYDEAYANPLKKLYKEKRDDSEKARFAVPKNPA
jgi:4-hydroxythreonine-4-phosphate dehydrogenase